jgi:methylated-DNA-protein-cysteine methyltransferase-like protein
MKKEKNTAQPAIPRQVSKTYEKIYAVVRRIPRGRVASYGQVARVAGLERQARLVGYALHSLPAGLERKVPWQRVINAKGYVSLRNPPGAGDIQRGLLESEGIEFDECDLVDLERFGWKPRRRG